MYKCSSCDVESKKGTDKIFDHCRELRHEIIYYPNNEQKENPTNIKELFEFAEKNLAKLVVSNDNVNVIFAKFHNNSHLETLDLDSTKALNWLMYNHRQDTKKFFAYESYNNALKHLKAQAQNNGSAREKIYLRIAQKENQIYYDLGSSYWKIICINSEGYSIQPYDVDMPFFNRTTSMIEQIKPKQDPLNQNPLETFCDLLRIKDDDKILFKVHLVHYFLQEQQTPIMVITGEHGSTKTTILWMVKRIVDPSDSGLGELKNEEDLQTDASNKFLVCYDNVSGFDHEISNTLCRIITGAEISKRSLYTNNDNFVKSYRAKIVLGGISPNIEFADFNDRSIYYETNPLKKHEQIPETTIRSMFNDLLPGLLDQIFTIISKTLKQHSELGDKIKPSSRMADFEVHGVTIGQVLGYEKNAFLERYKEKREKQSYESIESFPIVQQIRRFMENRKKDEIYQGYTAAFYQALTILANEVGVNTKRKESGWPQKPQFLTTQINRLKPELRNLGFELEIGPYTKRDGNFDHARSVITIRKLFENHPNQPNQPNQLENYEQNDPQGGKAELTNNPTIEQAILTKTEKFTNKNIDGKDGEAGKDDLTQSFICLNCASKWFTTLSLKQINTEHQKLNPNHRVVRNLMNDKDTIGGEGVFDE